MRVYTINTVLYSYVEKVGFGLKGKRGVRRAQYDAKQESESITRENRRAYRLKRWASDDRAYNPSVPALTEANLFEPHAHICISVLKDVCTVVVRVQ